jgi:hypothetical protein
MQNRLLALTILLLIGSSLGGSIAADPVAARDGGFVALWADALNSLPEGWSFANQFTDRFAYGASAGVDPGQTGGGPHTHTVDIPPTEDFSHADYTFTYEGNHHEVVRSTHTHSVDVPAFTSGAASPMPAHLRLAHVESASMETFPSGMIALWSGPLSSLPEAWAVCDGVDDRPDLQDRFVRGTLAEEIPGASVASTLAHTHPLDPPEALAWPSTEPTEGAEEGNQAIAPGDHPHPLDIPPFESGVTNTMPPYHELAFVILDTESAPPPIGLIVMWTGALADIPEGWVLCDGSDDTPGLQDRFIRGTESDEEPGATGGTSSSHDHVVGPVTAPTSFWLDQVEVETGNVFDVPPLGHTHDVTMPSFYSDAATALPPFITVAFIMYEGGEVSVPDDESIASAARLDPNYPNPFNPSTAIAFTLDQAGAVRLEIYDLRGRLVAMLVDEVLPAGRHEVMWDGTDSSGRAMSSGVYLSRFEANGHVAHGRLSLVQ